jgi:hypothetical protein
LQQSFDLPLGKAHVFYSVADDQSCTAALPLDIDPAGLARGREYLRIIYGPDYTAPENLTRLLVRRLAAKRGLAMREFALGVEALERFVRASLCGGCTSASSECSR